MVDLVREEKIERFVSLLNPYFPASKELIKHERAVCRDLGVEFLNIYKFENYSWIDALKGLKGKTYIHAYFFDGKIKAIVQAYHNDAEQTPGTNDREQENR